MKGSLGLGLLTWRTASARIRAVRSAAVAPSPNLSASQDKAPLKSAPVMCCTRSMAPPRPCWAMWSNHFPSFGPWARVMLNPSAFQRSGSALSCWKPRASKTSGSGNARILSAVAFCCTSAFSARSRFRRSLSAVASAAFLAVRSLSAVRARAKDGAALSADGRDLLIGPFVGVQQDARRHLNLKRSHGRGDLGVVATHPLVRGCAALDPAR